MQHEKAPLGKNYQGEKGGARGDGGVSGENLCSNIGTQKKGSSKKGKLGNHNN